MDSTAEQSQTIVPCGYVYNLTVTSNTSVMEGWFCGTAARTGSDPRDDRLLNGTSAIMETPTYRYSTVQHTKMGTSVGWVFRARINFLSLRRKALLVAWGLVGHKPSF